LRRLRASLSPGARLCRPATRARFTYRAGAAVGSRIVLPIMCLQTPLSRDRPYLKTVRCVAGTTLKGWPRLPRIEVRVWGRLQKPRGQHRNEKRSAQRF
jgi:hypothetical protein